MKFKHVFPGRFVVELLLAAGALGLQGATASAFDYKDITLESIASAGPCGGSVGCFTTVDNLKTGASQGDVVNANNLQTLPNASAYAFAKTAFAVQKAYADAYNARTTSYGYAETQATSEVKDVILGSSVAGGAYTFHFNVSGFLSTLRGPDIYGPDDGTYGAADYGYLYFTAYDAVNGKLLANTSTAFGDKAPSGVVNLPTVLTAGDDIKITVQLGAYAYSSSFNSGFINGPYKVVADYSDTLTYFVTSADATAPHLLGASGHDYSVNPASSVPEPSIWALLLAGFAGLAFLAQRQQKAAAEIVRV